MLFYFDLLQGGVDTGPMAVWSTIGISHGKGMSCGHLVAELRHSSAWEYKNPKMILGPDNHFGSDILFICSQAWFQSFRSVKAFEG
ncbi:hypothetical protein E2C01_075553 [Portunus trituberculatus]|uniref:Uncharacterized protein n=1 Tax=Portunus trituberculatus TaxID=210409 RepID=A0A5B7IFC4_PORTR|nr:hypothetical protein [Portunus trituberculatus]